MDEDVKFYICKKKEDIEMNESPKQKMETVITPIEEKISTQETEEKKIQEVQKKSRSNDEENKELQDLSFTEIDMPQEIRRSKRIKRDTNTSSDQLQVALSKEELKKKKEIEREKERALKALLKEKEQQEKEERRQKKKMQAETEKEDKKRKRMMEKHRKEEEKRLKEEEKHRKKIEKEAKQQEKYEAKKKKEEKRENTIEKKQDSQLKLQDFFHRTVPKENQMEIKDCFISDYETCFIPFFIKQHTLLSNQHAFIRSFDERIIAMKNIDEFLDSDFEITSPIKHLLSLFKITHIPSSRSSVSHITVKDIIQKYEKSISTDVLLSRLKAFPMKLLQFREDVRPPYYGTFSKPSYIITPRNPFKTDESLFNYHYDSEAEWIEEEEGENIDSINDSEEEDILALKEDEDDKDFLVDDDDEQNDAKKKVIMNLVPSIKGLYWQNNHDFNTDDYELFNKLKLETLLDVDFPIDPYKNYWSSKTCVNNAISNNSDEKIASQASVPSKTSLHFPQDLLPSFLKIIQGSTQTKVLLVETLRQKFTDISKQVIQWKLNSVARRNGKGINDTWAVDPSVWHSVFGKNQDV